MPSTRKTLHYISSALVTAISVGVLGYSMSAMWGKATMECTNSLTGKGFAVFTLGLFNGTLNRNDCPSFINNDPVAGNFTSQHKIFSHHTYLGTCDVADC